MHNLELIRIPLSKTDYLNFSGLPHLALLSRTPIISPAPNLGSPPRLPSQGSWSAQLMSQEFFLHAVRTAQAM
ncbi:MAG TPA: hypothetical protein VNT27_03335, partial [Propionibacteriaceae bacterium]|nr:hypothetical protein [Propionibacteriaceae bacterium]